MHLKYKLELIRKFELRNMGNVPIEILNISIEGLGCEAREFRILNCGPGYIL